MVRVQIATNWIPIRASKKDVYKCFGNSFNNCYLMKAPCFLLVFVSMEGLRQRNWLESTDRAEMPPPAGPMFLPYPNHTWQIPEENLSARCSQLCLPTSRDQQENTANTCNSRSFRSHLSNTNDHTWRILSSSPLLVKGTHAITSTAPVDILKS